MLPRKKKSATQLCSHLNAAFVLLCTPSPFIGDSHLSSLNMPFPFHFPGGIVLPPMQAQFPTGKRTSFPLFSVSMASGVANPKVS